MVLQWRYGASTLCECAKLHYGFSLALSRFLLNDYSKIVLIAKPQAYRAVALRALMDADDDVLATERAWIYDFHRYVLYELGRKDEAYNVCETAIDDIGDQAYEWQYLTDFNIVRRTLREC